jgi:hypothetical protein
VKKYGIIGNVWTVFGYTVSPYLVLAAAVHLAVLLVLQYQAGIFLFEGFSFFVPLPEDTERMGLYQILTAISTGLALLAFYQIIGVLCRRLRAGDRRVLYHFLIPFAALLTFYLMNLLVNWPGLYNIDDRAMYGLARHFLPFYWHSYMTSLFHMVGLTLFPFTSGQLVFLSVFLAFLFSYFFYRLCSVLAHKKIRWVKYLWFLLAVAPYFNLIASNSLRAYLYSVLNLIVFGYLIFEKLQGRTINPVKCVALATGFAVLAFWRSESIVYLFTAPFVLYFTYAGQMRIRQALLFALGTIMLYGVVNIPQILGNQKYYNSDYLIVSTTRPLSVLLNLDETYHYDGVDRDVERIEAVVDIEQILGLPYVCTSYQSSNTIRNNGHLSETMAMKSLQKQYIGAFLNIVKNNPGLFLKERTDLFLKMNHLQDVIRIDFGTDLEQWMEPSLAPYWIFNAVLQDNMIAPGEISNVSYWTAITFQKEPLIFIYALFPYLVIIFVTIIAAVIKKAWQIFFIQLSMLLREGIIFLTAPDAMPSYYMPSITLCVWISMLFVILWVSNRKQEEKVRLLT